MSTETAADFRFGGGGAWLDLLATSGRTFGPNPVERLTTADRLGDWLERVELTPEAPPGPTDVVQARRLRESLRAVALAVLDGESPRPEDTAELTGFLATAPPPAPVVLGERWVRPAPSSTTEALGRIAAQGVDQLTSSVRHTLAVCDEHDCRRVFVDTTGRRRWCPAPACASRGRVRALRARRRDGSEPPTDPT